MDSFKTVVSALLEKKNTSDYRHEMNARHFEE